MNRAPSCFRSAKEVSSRSRRAVPLCSLLEATFHLCRPLQHRHRRSCGRPTVASTNTSPKLSAFGRRRRTFPQEMASLYGSARKSAPIDGLGADAHPIVIALQRRLLSRPPMSQFDEWSELLRPIAWHAAADGEDARAGSAAAAFPQNIRGPQRDHSVAGGGLPCAACGCAARNLIPSPSRYMPGRRRARSSRQADFRMPRPGTCWRRCSPMARLSL